VEPSSIQLQTNSMTIRTGRFMPVVTLTVRTTNNPPVAMEDAYTVQENNPLNVLAPGVLVNDTDPDGDPLQAEVVGWPLPTRSTSPRTGGSSTTVRGHSTFPRRVSSRTTTTRSCSTPSMWTVS